MSRFSLEFEESVDEERRRLMKSLEEVAYRIVRLWRTDQPGAVRCRVRRDGTPTLYFLMEGSTTWETLPEPDSGACPSWEELVFYVGRLAMLRWG